MAGKGNKHWPDHFVEPRRRAGNRCACSGVRKSSVFGRLPSYQHYWLRCQPRYVDADVFPGNYAFGCHPEIDGKGPFAATTPGTQGWVDVSKGDKE